MIAVDRAAAHATAGAWLADARAVILDTETTSLDGYACEIAVIDMGGTALLNTLINPGEPISPGAAGIHGISDAMVADAPSFAAIAPALTDLLRGRLVIAYNAAFDRAVLAREMRRVFGSPHAGDLDAPDAITAVQEQLRQWKWKQSMQWGCAMEVYAAWYGEWSDTHQDYRYQRLDGGHRALGDAVACLERIRVMARPDDAGMQAGVAEVMADEQECGNDGFNGSFGCAC
jgi:DNA polymerase III epsilon subunit-like protein